MSGTGTIGSNIFVPDSILTDIPELGSDCHLSPFPQEIFPLAFIFFPFSPLRAKRPIKFCYLERMLCLFAFCSFFFQILKLEIEKVAAQRSFLFLWCGSHEGLNEGRKV